MKPFEITRQLCGADVTAWVLLLEGGLHISVCGGHLPHIGAVSIVDPSGKCTTIQFSGHKEGIVSERWAKKMAVCGYIPAVIEVGIHYDHLNAAGIAAVLKMTDEILEDVLRVLSAQKE